MKRILCVVRASTLRQEVESQQAEMLRFIKEKGFNESEIEWLVCKGASARKANKEYLKMLADIKMIIQNSETIRSVAVWHLNRLGRQMTYIYQMVEWFKENKIQLYVKNPDLTLLNPDLTYNTASDIVFAVFAAMVPAETEEMMAKLLRGKRAAKEKGKHWGGAPTFGFKIQDGYLVPDEEKMEIVKTIYDEYASGAYSYNKLRLEMIKRGVKLGFRHIALILKNPMYAPYLDPATIQKVNEIKGKNVYEFPKDKNEHLCTKLIRCVHCGKHYLADHKQYVCYTRKSYKRHTVDVDHCPDSPMVSVEIMDRVVLDAARWYRSQNHNENNQETIEEADRNMKVLIEKVIALKEEQANIEERKQRLQDLFVDLVISPTRYREKMAQIDSDAAKIAYEIEAVDKEYDRNFRIMRGIVENKPDQVEIHLLQGLERRDEVRKLIEEVNVLRVPFLNRKCVMIVIRPFYGENRYVLYDPYGCKRGTRPPLYLVHDGKVSVYGSSESYGFGGGGTDITPPDCLDQAKCPSL